MSIHDAIRDSVQRGQLYRVLPRLLSSPVERHIFAVPEIYRLVEGPWVDETEEYRCGLLWEDFDRFIEGRLITVALENPFKKPKTTYLARLDPSRDEVWEIRSRDPKPSIRVFGRFAARDHLVLTNWGYRKGMGGKDSPQFKLAMHICKTEWRKLFPSYEPLSGIKVNEYVKQKAVPV